jgi:hypothetical protein
MTPALAAYLRRLREEGPLRVGAAPEAVIRDAEAAGYVRYHRPHARVITAAGVAALERVDA